LARPETILLKIFFWYVLLVSLFTAGLQLFAPAVYVERELRYTAVATSRRRWGMLGTILILATPLYVWLFFHFHRAAWIAISIAMTYVGAAEFLLRFRPRAAAGLRIQSYAFALLNLIVAAIAAFFLRHPQ
jgi:hypothetical protein